MKYFIFLLLVMMHRSVKSQEILSILDPGIKRFTNGNYDDGKDVITGHLDKDTNKFILIRF